MDDGEERDAVVARLDPPATPGQTTEPAPEPEFRLADAEALLVTAMEQLTAATPYWVIGAALFVRSSKVEYFEGEA